MNEIDEALKSVLDRPGDDAAKLAYADALATGRDPLGEFIRREYEIAGAARDEDETLGLQDRQVALLDAHREAWLGPLAEIAEWVHLEGGMVGQVLLDMDAYLAHGDAILGRFPIRSLAIRGARGRVGDLLASRWIDRIEYLSLRPEGEYREGLGDEDVIELAASDRLRNLRGLALNYNVPIGPRSVEAILDAPWCGRLELLDLGWSSVGDEGAALIASSDRLDRLRRLKLWNTKMGTAGACALADSPTLALLGLTELDFRLNDEISQEGNARLLCSSALARVESVGLDCPIDTELVDAFVRSDSLGSLKRLESSNSWSIDTDSLRRLARWPGLSRLDNLMFVLSGLNDEQLEILSRSPWLGDLKSLCLSETRVTDEGVERFCRSPAWRGLTSLGIDRNRLTERSVRAILGAGWFPRLRSLDLHASYTIGDAGASVLASYRGPTRLRTLTLSLGGIGDAGALALAEAPFASQLWRLWLRGNDAISTTAGDCLKGRLGGRVYLARPDRRPTVTTDYFWS
ncbi:hypothetical protein [Aquisphaera insulae]|uniref:hypothetical protein n=1 Tax=Aquisphaera insulae TaxID=2712864 RepID=UPI0013EA601D|nr:hypothetical protein [Aquisphaera insulae]